MNSVEGLFGKLKGPYQKLALGGVMLSILIFLFHRFTVKATILLNCC